MEKESEYYCTWALFVLKGEDMSDSKNLGQVHLYKYNTKEQKIIEQVGDIIVTEKTYYSPLYGCIIPYSRRAEIEIKNDVGKVKKVLVVSSEEGIVFNNMVWLHEPNNQRAAKILMDHEKEIIRELSLKISMHEEARDYLYRIYGRNDVWKV